MKRQSGVTLLIVMVIVALTALIAAQLAEHSGYSFRRTQLFLGKEQAYQLALGGEELAKLWLAKGFENSQPDEPVHLDQPWATTPMEFPIEGGMIKATVTDARSCFNLNTLAEEARGPNGQAGPSNPPELPSRSIYKDLLQGVLEDVEVTPDALMASLADWVDPDMEPVPGDGAEDLEYMGYPIPYRTANNLIANKSELRVIKGYNAKVYDNIKDFVCVLPDREINVINVNTIAEEHAPLLKAMLGNDAAEQVSTLLSERSNQKNGYDSDSFKSAMGPGFSEIPAPRLDRIGFTSDYFFVNISVEYKDAKFKMGSLMKRPEEKNQPFQVVSRYFGDY